MNEKSQVHLLELGSHKLEKAQLQLELDLHKTAIDDHKSEISKYIASKEEI